MSVSIQDPRATPRNLAEQLRRFVQTSEGPPSANGSSLSDAGFLLLTLKDQLLVEGPRSSHFAQEFVSRPNNGMETLGKVVMVLQAIVNATHSTSKLSSLLARNPNNNNRKRKAAVAEADCIECIKILLEKSSLQDVAWRHFLESATGLDAILNSVHSPQLDSKCYALEILLILLDQNQGFVILMRALTALSARNRDYLRLTLFVTQLKHGLHTNKLHIQILVVRLFNKLMANAPSPVHRNIVKSEAQLGHFSAEYIEKLLSSHQGTLGGVDILMEEVNIWKSLNNQYTGATNIDINHIYGLSETESDTNASDRARRARAHSAKYPSGTTTVVKNVERQRFKKQGMGSGGRAAAPMYYPSDTNGRHTTASFYPDRRALTLSNRENYNNNESSYSPTSQTQTGYAAQPSQTLGGMRRAKSESAMVIEDREEMMDSIPRGLKRYDQEQPLYHPIQQTKMMSRSVHDLSMREEPSTFMRPSSTRPASAASRPILSPRAMSPTKESLMTDSRRDSPPRIRYASPISPRARFADPPIVEAQQPHAGFSYLFPQQPVLASVVPRRSVTPEPYSKQASLSRPPSAPVYTRPVSPASRVVSPNPPPPPPPLNSRPVYTQNGQVVYIPINMEDGRRLSKNSRFEPRTDYPTESRSSSRTKLRSPSINGEDVRDALSQFDYLNEYDNSSIRGREREVASYHF